MSADSMSIQQAFPICSATVCRDSAAATGDVYFITWSEDDQVRLEAARSQLQHAAPEVDDEVIVQSAVADAAYRMPARIIDCCAGEWVSIICKQAGEIERVQRRNTRRVFVSFPVEVRPESSDAAPVSTSTEDLNTESMRVLSPREIPPAETVSIRLDIEDGGAIVTCEGFVARCRRVNSELFEIGIRFRSLEYEFKQRIVSALMQRFFQV